MTIDIDNNCISIFDASAALGPADISQLLFWNFLNESNTTYRRDGIDEQVFLKLLRYFNNENIDFRLSEHASTFNNSLAVKNQNFLLLKKKAKDYKNGVYNKAEFEKFREFTFDSIQRPLKIHQLKAAFHLYLLGNGANFSVPGSGKTTVVLTVYEKLRAEGKVNTLFVVGPPSCFGPWKNEFIETLGRKPNHVILAGGNKTNRKNQYYSPVKQKAEMYLTTFQSLLYDQKDVEYFFSQKEIKALLVVDEAHYIKQINGNWASAILNQSRRAKYKCVLTGTPIPKSYSDIYNLFDFLWPENQPIPTNDKTKIKVSEQRGNGHSIKTILEENIGPLFYRVRKSDLSLTKPNFVEPTLIKMHKYERLIFDAVLKRIKNYSKKDYLKNIDFVNKLAEGRIMRLRQCVSYTKLLNTAIVDYNEEILEDMIDLKKIIRNYDTLESPAKLNVLIKMLRSFKKKNLKVVIWTNFIETIKLLERTLKHHKFNCKKIYGGTPIEGSLIRDEETREKIRDEFVSPESGLDILIANPAACAESISLHKTCHHAIYYDLNYNCAQYLQSLDRIHRVGGSETKEANYHFLLYENSIDLEIKNNLDEKTRRMFAIVEQEYPIYSLNMFEGDGDTEAYKRIFHK